MRVLCGLHSHCGLSARVRKKRQRDESDDDDDDEEDTSWKPLAAKLQTIYQAVYKLKDAEGNQVRKTCLCLSQLLSASAT